VPCRSWRFPSPLAFVENLCSLFSLTGLFFSYCKTLFQVQLIRPVARNGRGNNNEQYARKQLHYDRRSLFQYKKVVY
jgi:hypothetical protein